MYMFLFAVLLECVSEMRIITGFGRVWKGCACRSSQESFYVSLYRLHCLRAFQPFKKLGEECKFYPGNRQSRFTYIQ